MTIIEQIKAEIESLKSIEYPCDNSQQATGFFNALDRMTDFLSTLESEKPVPADLEEAKEAYCEEHNDDCFDATGDKCPHIRNAFIAGAKWQYQKDRYEFAKLKAKEWSDGYDEGIAKGKEQMMKEARNHFVYNVLSGNDMKKMIEIYNDEVSCKPGNVVRIIIVKE